MKNSYNMAQAMMDGGLISIITNKKTKPAKRYGIFIGCILFYLVLIEIGRIGLCLFNGIGNFNKNMFLFFLLNIIGILLIVDLLRLVFYVEKNMK